MYSATILLLVTNTLLVHYGSAIDEVALTNTIVQDYYKKNSTVLCIDFQRISVIKDDAFLKCYQATSIYLSNNAIRELNNQIFKQAYNLEVLDLSVNEITELANDVFEKLKCLTVLNLYNNQLLNLEPDVFKELTKVVTLDLSKNFINVLDAKIFFTNLLLKHLVLSSNYIDNLPDTIFHTLTDIQNINLGRNRISAITNQLFSKLISVKIINLSINLITSVQSGSFDNNEQLEQLYLENNLISEIPIGLFKNQIKLKLLSLSYNKIAVIHRNTLPRNSALERILLRGNRLKHLDPAILQSSQQLITLSLHSNPWNCDCKLRGLLKFSKNYTSSVFTCATPIDLQQKSWEDLQLKDLKCSKETEMMVNDSSIPDIFAKDLTFSCNITTPDVMLKKGKHMLYGNLLRDNGVRYRFQLDFAEEVTKSVLQLGYIDSVEDESAENCDFIWIISGVVFLLFIICIILFILYVKKKMKTRSEVISGNVKKDKVNFSSLPDCEVENNLYQGQVYETID